MAGVTLSEDEKLFYLKLEIFGFQTERFLDYLAQAAEGEDMDVRELAQQYFADNPQQAAILKEHGEEIFRRDE